MIPLFQMLLKSFAFFATNLRKSQFVAKFSNMFAFNFRKNAQTNFAKFCKQTFAFQPEYTLYIYRNSNIGSDLVPYAVCSLLAVYLTVRKVLALLGF
jgi:hypothetical protein